MSTVEEALASGTWKERVQPGTGRKYYVHVLTKKSVWNLEAHLKKGGGVADDGVQQPSPKSVRDERHEKMRKRAEAEAQLRATIASLEAQKVELEAEVARLQGPVEAETAAVLALRQELSDAGFSLQAVEQEVMEKRRQRTAELRDIQTRVAALQSVAESERKHREAVEHRHGQLVAESLDLKADITKEQVTADALRQSVRAAELKLDEATAELARQRAEIAGKEQEVAAAERDLAAVTKRKAFVASEVERLKLQIAEVRHEIGRSSADSGTSSSVGIKGSRTAAASKGAAADSLDLLKDLALRYETKRKALNDLVKLEEEEGDVTACHHSNNKLRRLIDDATKDRDALEKLLRILNGEVQHASTTIAEYRGRLQELREQVASMPTPRDWPHRTAVQQ